MRARSPSVGPSVGPFLVRSVAVAVAALLALAAGPRAQLVPGGPAAPAGLGQGATSTAPGRPHAAPDGGAPGRPNLVLIVADDMGVDLVGAYAEGSAPPCTPNLDALAAGGMLFRNAWANPVCSPTRAALLTGRYGFRTGVGAVVAPTDAGLSLAETLLPEALTGYASTAVGKWHLAGNQGNLHPNASGFGHYAGALGGGIPNYSMWPKVTDGSVALTTTYATTDTTDEAIAALHAMPEPWLLYVAYNAPHTPFHAPPSAACGAPACADTWCGSLPANPTDRDLAKAMVEAMDAGIGRLLAELAAVDPDAYVVFLGDNGTAQQASQPPFVPSHAKGTLYEGGVNVPFVVRGPGVVPGESAALVGVADVYATFAELAGVPSAAQDSVSLVPCFASPRVAVRPTVYAESFPAAVGAPPYAEHARAVRGERYKLIRTEGAADQLYDLLSDPFETSNLLPGLSAAEQAAYEELIAALAALGMD